MIANNLLALLLRHLKVAELIGRAQNVVFTGLAQVLGQLQASDMDFSQNVGQLAQFGPTLCAVDFPFRCEDGRGTDLCQFRPPKVRKTPSWPRSWANFSHLQLHSHRNCAFWANLIAFSPKHVIEARLEIRAEAVAAAARRAWTSAAACRPTRSRAANCGGCRGGSGRWGPFGAGGRSGKGVPWCTSFAGVSICP